MAVVRNELPRKNSASTMCPHTLNHTAEEELAPISDGSSVSGAIYVGMIAVRMSPRDLIQIAYWHRKGERYKMLRWKCACDSKGARDRAKPANMEREEQICQ